MLVQVHYVGSIKFYKLGSSQIVKAQVCCIFLISTAISIYFMTVYMYACTLSDWHC